MFVDSCSLYDGVGLVASRTGATHAAVFGPAVETRDAAMVALESDAPRSPRAGSLVSASPR